MRKRKQVAKDFEEVKRAMDETKDVREFRILQCIYLADKKTELSACDIGEIVGFNTHRVKVIHSNFRKYGMDSIKDKRGGRYREYMTLDEEASFLAPFEKKSQTGTLAVAGEIKRAYEEKVNKTVSESTIYRLLDRHDFRKIVPYKRHKKADTGAQEAFKKTSPLS